MRQNKSQTNVYKFDLDGKLLAVYGSITEAARENNVSQTCIANAIYDGTKYNMSHNYIWLRETMKDAVFDVIEKRKSDMSRESRIKKTQVRKSKVYVDTRVERRGNYIFIEKNLPANERCLRCGIYNTDLECPPCDKRDREDNKVGYWRFCKPMDF